LTLALATGIDRRVKSGEMTKAQSKPRAPDQDRLRHDLNEYMLKRGLRSTEQRRLIIDTFFEQHEHITIDSLLKQVRAVDARVGYATVYRTMKLLSESGVVQEHKFGDGFTRYELSDEDAHHDHLVCLECSKIIEFEEPQIEVLQDRVAKKHGFLVRAHKHEMYGVCADCQKPKGVRGGRDARAARS
jgi:Fur family transcriptional regulator, ferric uptake regulator